MLTIGLTGGIGSGKTTVANMFAALGITIIDADNIAKELVANNQAVFTSIIQHFDPIVLNPDGSLNRRHLREIIFAQPEERRWLEDMLHPLIYQEIALRIQQADSTYCMVVIPLLLETGHTQLVDQILVVDTTESTQRMRTQLRDQISQEQIDAILQAQLPRQERLAKANQIITNTGSLEDLEQQVVKLHQFYLQLAQSDVHE